VIGIPVAFGIALFVIAPSEFRTSKTSTNLLNVQSLSAILYDFAILGYTCVKRPERRFEAGILFVAWMFIIGSFSAGNLLTNESRPIVQLVPVTWTIFMLAHAGLIARGFLRAQRALNVDHGPTKIWNWQSFAATVIGLAVWNVSSAGLT